jgi:ribosomal protein S13
MVSKKFLPFGIKNKILSVKKELGFNKKTQPFQLKKNIVMQYKFNTYFSKKIITFKIRSNENKYKNIKFLKKINSYKGRRHYFGLPARGQRTKTNSKTLKKKKKNERYNRY